MSFWRMTLREIQHRAVRTGLTVLSVALGTAAVISVALTSSTVRMAQSSMFAALVGKTDFIITAEGGASFDADLLPSVAQVSGVRVAVPTVQRSTLLYVGDKRAKTQILGVDSEVDQLVRDYEVVVGEMPSSGSALALDERFAKSMGMELGSEVKLLTRSGLQAWKVAALLRHQGASSLSQGGVLYGPLRTVQSQFRIRQKLDRIEVLRDQEGDRDRVRESIAEILPVGIGVKAPAQDNQMADQTIRAAELGLTLATAFALMIAVFTIFNTFQMVVGERRRQLGILRAIGATRKQIEGFVMREALMLGAIGTVVGSLVGVVGAFFLVRATSQVLQTGMPDPQVHWWPFALAVVFGLGISWAGAFLPARRAGMLSPAEAMQVVIASEMRGSSWRWPALGGLLVALGGGLHLGCFLELLSMKWTIAASVSILVGIVFLLPLIVEPTSRCVQRLIRPLLGVESGLAHRQLLRHRSRTAMTASVLFIAISTGIGLGLTIMDNIRDVDVWCSRALVGDFFVRATMPDMSTGRSADLSDAVGEELRAMEGVEKVTPLRFVSARSGENSVIVVIRKYQEADAVYFDVVDGKTEEIGAGLANGEVAIGSVLSERLKIHRGDVLPMETLSGVREYRIAGVVNDYIAGGLTVYMDRGAAEVAFQVEGQDAYIVDAMPDRASEVESRVQALCEAEGLLFQSNADLVEMIRSMSRGVNAGLWGLLALGSAIASFGLVNTLSMNIIEQTREIGLLRVVAMTRAQVRRMIVSQALLLGIVGFVPGALMGGVIAYLINLSTYTATGHDVELVLRPWFFLSSIALAMIMAVAASLIPAERAARIHLKTALGYE
ncbi:ABC transporter permease YtrF precursor [Pirellula sp. SH-Sr6A]|uniref:FtsX-like permease family protein n=1 Tax=Pirellula sp. SH-Sr6A TaxID=1632865 RepID=UPI00078EDF06|nr:FtsX-like permease family protein [Pirellula sp. SH-Sr6A]AMV33633.1 ABC transporter permease YtrF precursor [Pirellula sp. SH-Sr6A]